MFHQDIDPETFAEFHTVILDGYRFLPLDRQTLFLKQSTQYRFIYGFKQPWSQFLMEMKSSIYDNLRDFFEAFSRLRAFAWAFLVVFLDHCSPPKAWISSCLS